MVELWEEWHDWISSGGEDDLPHDVYKHTRVQVRLRNGEVGGDDYRMYGNSYRWDNADPMLDDIVAYRILSPFVAEEGFDTVGALLALRS